MVLAYICKTHGQQSDCDVSKAGERICPECGVHVTAVTGRTRDSDQSPPTDKSGHTAGDIRWRVDAGREGKLLVDAHGYIEAVDAAIERVDDPQSVKEVGPVVDRYARL